MTERRLDHLDPATIAALVDRTLSAEERAATESHLAVCADCREVWVETNEIAGVASAAQTGPVAARPTSRRWMYAGAGLAAAAAIAFAVFSPALFNRGDRPELRALVEAVGENRRTEARLTGGFKWGPVPSVTRGAGSVQQRDVDLEASRLQQDAATTSDANALGAAASAALLTGNIEQAIAWLRRAVELEGDNAMLWSDFAASHLEQARVTGDPSAAEQARYAAERALALAPDLPEARFNRAMALSYLGRREEAIAAWRDYLSIDSDSGWAAEARRRLEGGSQ